MADPSSPSGRASTGEPAATRAPWPSRNVAVAVGAVGWLVAVALCLGEGRAPAPPGSAAAVLVLVALWHGWAFGRLAGVVAAVAGAALALLALRGLGVVDMVGLGLGLLAAGVGGGLLGERGRRLREELATRDGEAAALQASLAEARGALAELRRRLGQAERLATVGTMSAQIAHQLRNPLTSMGLYLQLVEDELRTLGRERAGEALELLHRVLGELAVLGEITDNYLQYARLPELEPTLLDVNPAVGELVRFLRHEMERKGIALSARLAEGLPPVEADRRLLRFALMNLLKNAAEAMDAGGRLRVRTCHHNGAIEIHVSDTGPGIPPEEVARVFEPFYTTKDSGSGLGLSLTRQIIEKHAGALTCESMVGVGTTFIVRLPARAGDGSASDGGSGEPDGSHRG